MAETKKQAETLLGRYKDSLNETQYKMLEDQIGLQGYTDSTEGFDTWIGSTSDLKNKKGDNFGVTIDGSTFSKLELGSDAPQSVVNAVKTKIDSGNLPENTLFVSSLDDNVYIVLSGGKIKRVGGQGGAFKVDYEGKGAGYRDYTNLKDLLKRRGQII